MAGNDLSTDALKDAIARHSRHPEFRAEIAAEGRLKCTLTYQLPMREILPEGKTEESLTMAERLVVRYKPKDEVIAKAVKRAIPEGSYSITHSPVLNAYGQEATAKTPPQTNIEFLATPQQLKHLGMAIALEGMRAADTAPAR